MTTADHWLLPDGIEEILPPHARHAELLRRELLDLFDRWGYDLVIPPDLEFMESLTVGVGRDLELDMFKVTDQLTGRMMGLRADTTPAVARIDAHTLNKGGPVRLCYAGSVFRTRPASLGASRSPIQLGVELYGHSGIESDSEVISLMLETLAASGVTSVSLDLGHVLVYRELTAFAGLDAEQERVLFEALQRKAACEVDALLAGWKVATGTVAMFKALVSLVGSDSVPEKARKALKGAPRAVFAALDEVEAIAEQVMVRYPNVTLNVDLGELRGYHYHTGAVFSAYVPGCGQAIAKGGRYDGIGQAFGRARPATGFSTDLKMLLEFKAFASEGRPVIFAPFEVDDAVVEQLRGRGYRVVCELAGQKTGVSEARCNRQLVCRNGEWVVEEL